MGKQHRYTYIRERSSTGGIAVSLYKNGMLLYSYKYFGGFGIARWRASRKVALLRRIYSASAA